MVVLDPLELALHTGSCKPLHVDPENRTRPSAKAGEPQMLLMWSYLFSPLRMLHCDHLQVKSYIRRKNYHSEQHSAVWLK